jgi:uncharacterized protein YqgC (DUF456 family)
MDILFITLALFFIVLGLLGCILPVIPGPPLSFIGILLLHFSPSVHFTSNFLILWAFIAIAVTALDYIVPIWGTKKYGGTKYGTWGSMIGLIIGLFFGPTGIIAGPFLGALVGELIGGRESQDAFKAAKGAFVGFLLGVGLKLIASGFMAYYFFSETGSLILNIFS